MAVKRTKSHHIIQAIVSIFRKATIYCDKFYVLAFGDAFGFFFGSGLTLRNAETASSYFIGRESLFFALEVGWVSFSNRDRLPFRTIINPHRANSTFFSNAGRKRFLPTL